MPSSPRTFWWWVLGLAGFEFVSWVAYRLPHGMAIALAAIAIVVLALAWRRPLWLGFLTVAELAVGGKGYLLFTHVGPLTISIRQLLFLFLIVRFGPIVIRRWSSVWPQRSMQAVTWLAVWVAVMVGWGILRHNSPGNVFFDANAFGALAYLPLWWVSLTSEPNWRTNTWSVVLAGATIVGLKSLLVVLLFGHAVSFIGPLYHWIRDTGIGEITLINSNVYRVFFQSQILDLLVFLVLLSAFVRHQFSRWQWFPFLISTLGVYISLSRSFWLGLVAGVVMLLIATIRKQEPGWWRLSIVIPIALFTWLATSWAINFPAVFGHGQVNPLLARLTSNQSVQASTARLNQIRPLVRAIGHHPIVGSGFGTTVTYFSTDPRVHGWRTTTAFELGYFDLWLKIGLVGVALYAWWLWVLGRGAWRKSELGLLTSLLALIIVHLTSPYLNHPLGISWLAITTLMLYA